MQRLGVAGSELQRAVTVVARRRVVTLEVGVRGRRSVTTQTTYSARVRQGDAYERVGAPGAELGYQQSVWARTESIHELDMENSQLN